MMTRRTDEGALKCAFLDFLREDARANCRPMFCQFRGSLFQQFHIFLVPSSPKIFNPSIDSLLFLSLSLPSNFSSAQKKNPIPCFSFSRGEGGGGKKKYEPEFCFAISVDFWSFGGGVGLSWKCCRRRQFSAGGRGGGDFSLGLG